MNLITLVWEWFIRYFLLTSMCRFTRRCMGMHSWITLYSIYTCIPRNYTSLHSLLYRISLLKTLRMHPPRTTGREVPTWRRSSAYQGKRSEGVRRSFSERTDEQTSVRFLVCIYVYGRRCIHADRTNTEDLCNLTENGPTHSKWKCSRR